MAETILSSPLVVNAILPFVLIFTVMFAILQKSKILGDGKKQIDAIVALVIALIVISFANAVGVINSLMPFLAVSVVIILVFLMLYSLVFQGKENFTLHKGLQWTIFGLIAIATIIAVVISTGAWEYINNEWIIGNDNSAIITNAIFIVIILGAIAIALWGGGKEKKDKD